MRLPILMPDVSECDVTGCAYNVDRDCHARAITVGDGLHPACDTFLKTDRHVRDQNAQAGVGACKVSSCRHNDDYECHATAIKVGTHGEHADCVTFETI